MRNNILKPLAVCAVSAAVITVAFAAVVVSGNRADTARRKLARAQELSAQQQSAERTSANELAAAAANQAAKEAELLSITNKLAQTQADAEAKKLEIEHERASKERLEADLLLEETIADAKLYESEAIAATAVVLKAQAEIARDLVEREHARKMAETAKAEKERLAKERAEAELKLFEAQRLDLEAWAQQLADQQRELDEREAALKPEKTVADLLMLGCDENGNDTNTMIKVRSVLPEDDLSLPESSRNLAKAERLMREREAELKAVALDGLKTKLEDMMKQAAREGRVIDAKYYERVLHSL